MESNNTKSHTLPAATGRGVKPALPPRPIRSRSMTFTGTNRITSCNTSNRSSTNSRLRGNSVDALLIDYNEPVGTSSNESNSSSHSLASNEQQHNTPGMIQQIVTDSLPSSIVSNHNISEEHSNIVVSDSEKDSNHDEGEKCGGSNEEDKSTIIVNDKEGQLSIVDGQSDALIEKVEEEKDIKVKPNRPPMPSRPPPPLTRPPRPFPPPPPPSRPSPSSSPPPPSINEAKLARKRPPPTPPLIIDSRSNADHVPHSQRTFKGDSSPKHNIAKSNIKPSALPKRPPPPTVHVSPVHQLVTVNDNTDDTTGNASIGDNYSEGEGSEKTSCSNEVKGRSLSSPHHLGVLKEDKFSEEEDKEVDETLPEQSPSSSPHQSRKLLGKVTQSIRTFSKRRVKTVRETNSNSSDESPRNWKRVFSTRTTKSQSDIPTQTNDLYPDKLSTGVVDPLLVQCVAYLNKEDVLQEPGLFRIPGDLSVIKRLRSQFIAGEFVDFSDIMDPNIITGLLKIYFREKLHPLISDRPSLSKAVAAAKNKDVDSFKETLDDLDDVTLASLRMLSELFKKITEYSEVNHMTSGILATSCGPSFFPNTQPSNANNLVKFLTDNCDVLFAI